MLKLCITRMKKSPIYHVPDLQSLYLKKAFHIFGIALIKEKSLKELLLEVSGEITPITLYLRECG